MTSHRYESVVLDSIPAGCKRALDVGCGNGELTRDLRRRGIPEVVGLDRDEQCIQRCRAHPQAGDIRYIAGDLLTGDLEPASFDLVCAVATLHHTDARTGLARLRSLVAPQGVLVVIGLARSNLPKDLPVEIAAQIVGPFRRPRRRPEVIPEPTTVWPPPESYSTMRQLTTELLPNARWRRHLLWRYSLVWTNISS
jgi:2-polyprenyl-3-methyl-5-hydroxy-6-metoxy-1,4-benzoquinol methylase